MATLSPVAPPGQPAPRPNSIIVFDHADGQNAHRVAQVLNVGESARAPRRRGRAVLQAGQVGQAESVVYESLGVAVAHLTNREIERLERAQGVRRVLANERRSLPTRVAGHAEAGRGDRSTTWALQAMKVEPGHTPTGRGVKVAVLDTGLDVTHPDFARFRWGPANARNFVDETGIGNIADPHGHGTHCSGLVAGPFKPLLGPRYAVAPEADMIVGRVLDASGVGSDDRILDALDWAVREAGARVLNLSLGSPRALDDPESVLYETVAFNLLHHDARGALLIAAAGNDSVPGDPALLRNPASCASVVAVGAIDSRLNAASFSCRGGDGCELQLVGPGVDILSAWKDDTYVTLSGTSMAAPCATGIAALMLEADPTLTAVDLRTLMLGHARALGDAETFGYGLVQWSSSRLG